MWLVVVNFINALKGHGWLYGDKKNCNLLRKTISTIKETTINNEPNNLGQVL